MMIKYQKISFIMPNKGKSATISLVEQEAKIPIDKNEIPNFINNFLVSIGQDIEVNDDLEELDINDMYNPNPLQFQMHEMTVTEEMLHKIIMNINIYKSSSIENVNTFVLKDAFMVILPQLVKLFQLSLTVCIFPNSWKIANVILLQKPGDPTNVNNLRPSPLKAHTHYFKGNL